VPPGTDFERNSRVRLAGHLADDETMLEREVHASHLAAPLIFAVILGASPARAELGPPTQLADLTTIGDLCSADLDGDGLVDFVLGTGNGGDVRWYRNLGGGAFAAPVILSVPFDYYQTVSFAAADFEGDGDVDLLAAVQEYESSLGVWYSTVRYVNQGGGVFSMSYLYGPNATDMELVDLDGDGDLDWLYLDWPADVSWRANDGTGAFEYTVQSISTSVNGARSLHAADLDGNGTLDVQVGVAALHELVWFANDGNGGFGAAQTVSTDFRNPRDVDAADLDEDGDLDFLAGSLHDTGLGGAQYDGQLVWCEKLGGGSFGSANVLLSEFPGGTSEFRAVDLDGDGRLDFTCVRSRAVTWYRGLGGGVFSPGRETTSTDIGLSRLELANFDDDPAGLLDAVTSTWLSGVVELYPQLPSSAATGFCSGPAATAACPCGNVGGELEGCANSTGAGVRLHWAGSASVAAGDLAVSAYKGTAGQAALFFQAIHAISLPFVDGLRCVGGSVQRLRLVTFGADGAANVTYDLAGLSVGIAPGTTRHYQLWYRDPTGPCGAGSNLSSAMTVVWQ